GAVLGQFATICVAVLFEIFDFAGEIFDFGCGCLEILEPTGATDYRIGEAAAAATCVSLAGLPALIGFDGDLGAFLDSLDSGAVARGECQPNGAFLVDFRVSRAD